MRKTEFLVNGRTKVIGLIGYPVEHTASPPMHNAVFQKLDLDYVYIPFSIPPEDLLSAIKAMKTLNFVGFNVTIPHKKNIIKYLDEVDYHARLVGSVNTVIRENGRFIGYNTDGEGFIKSLEEKGVEVEGKTIFLIGAGGAAWAIAFAMMERKPRRIFILNRDMDNAEFLRIRLTMAYRKSTVLTLPHKKQPLKYTLQVTDLLINATPVGMDGESIPFDLEIEHLPPHAVIYDLIYSPPLTPLLKKGRNLGLKVINGVGMLVHQGAISLKMWLGIDPPLDVMKKAVEEFLSQKFGEIKE